MQPEAPVPEPGRLPRPRQADRRARTREALLDSAARELSRFGYGNLVLERVAREAGFTRGALYHQFADKEALTMAVIEWVRSSWIREIGPLVDEEVEPVAALLTLARGHARFCRRDVARMPIALRLEFSGQDHPVGREVEANYSGLVDLCATLIDTARRAGSIPDGPPTAVLAVAFLGALEGTVIGLTGQPAYDELLAARAVAGVLGVHPALADGAAVVDRLRAAGCVFAEDEASLMIAESTDPAALEDMILRRVAGLPLEQILGWAEFHRLRIAVEPGVFVPRRRTELLVELAIELAGPTPVVVDLCCGSGAIGAALSHSLALGELYAADLDPVAVHCARRNIRPPGHVLVGDLYAALPTELRGRVELLVVNAPYVPTDEIALMPPEARDHEPMLALDGGPDGLVVQRRVAAEAPEWLRVGGHLLVETSEAQAPLLAEVYASAGLTARVVRSEELDATVVVGTRGG